MLLPSPLDHSVQRILCPTVFEPQIKLLNPPPFYIYVSFEIFRVGGWWVEELTFLAALRISVLIILVCQCRTVIFFSKNNLFLIGKVSDFGYVHKLSWRYICCQIFLLINPSLCILLPPFRTPLQTYQSSLHCKELPFRSLRTGPSAKRDECVFSIPCCIWSHPLQLLNQLRNSCLFCVSLSNGPCLVICCILYAIV
jgi:hypothetical protein